MAAHRAWTSYWPTFRAKQMEILAGWIEEGESGAVVGASGSGKTNLLGFLCYYPNALKPYLRDQTDRICLVPVDLNNLPAYNLATFYRVVLRAFYEVRDRFTPDLQDAVTELYLANRAERDPFLSQSALRELLLRFQEQAQRVVLVFDRFDHFCQVAPSTIFNTLHGLRDAFKPTLSYIVAISHEIHYLPEPEILGNLHALLDRLVCWVGPMNEVDSCIVIEREIQKLSTLPSTTEMEQLLALTGGYPTLLKVACRWWAMVGCRLPTEEWLEHLLTQPSIQYRLEKIWDDLTQEEQLTLFELQKQPNRNNASTKYLALKYQRTLDHLVERDLCRNGNNTWSLRIELLAAYMAKIKGQNPNWGGRGQLWLDPETGQLYQGDTSLENLSPLERSILIFLINQTDRPGKLFTKTEILTNAWPDQTGYDLSDEVLEQMIHRLRKKIEPDPPRYRYLVTYRARRGQYEEGGYRFYPEGRHKDQSNLT